ncbi:unnamed protein product [Cuscuta campestris]|uniref:Uncharacterized protein n=1 Tax=Cuscuta campestris TaxID=132261 RepID=A0A484MNU0_9ASTE|nr:unnamed protein product [Cuscuta campestris]
MATKKIGATRIDGSGLGMKHIQKIFASLLLDRRLPAAASLLLSSSSSCLPTARRLTIAPASDTTRPKDIHGEDDQQQSKDAAGQPFDRTMGFLLSEAKLKDILLRF